MYFASLITAILFFAQSKYSIASEISRKDTDRMEVVDVIAVPQKLVAPLMMRGTMGFFSDVLLFLAYNYISFGKA